MSLQNETRPLGAAGPLNTSCLAADNQRNSNFAPINQALCRINRRLAAHVALGEPARLAILVAAVGEQLSIAVSLFGRAAR
jgi:hypothetical protein